MATPSLHKLRRCDHTANWMIELVDFKLLWGLGSLIDCQTVFQDLSPDGVASELWGRRDARLKVKTRELTSSPGLSLVTSALSLPRLPDEFSAL